MLGYPVLRDHSLARQTTKDGGILEEPIRRFPFLETGAQCFSFSDGLAETRPLELLHPVEGLLVDMPYPSLPRLSSGEDHKWSKASHEVNEAVGKAGRHMLGHFEGVNQVSRSRICSAAGLATSKGRQSHPLPPGEFDAVGRVFQPDRAQSLPGKLGRKCSAPASDIDDGPDLRKYFADGGHHLRRILKRV